MMLSFTFLSSSPQGNIDETIHFTCQYPCWMAKSPTFTCRLSNCNNFFHALSKVHVIKVPFQKIQQSALFPRAWWHSAFPPKKSGVQGGHRGQLYMITTILLGPFETGTCSLLAGTCHQSCTCMSNRHQWTYMMCTCMFPYILTRASYIVPGPNWSELE